MVVSKLFFEAFSFLFFSQSEALNESIMASHHGQLPQGRCACLSLQTAGGLSAGYFKALLPLRPNGTGESQLLLQKHV